MNAHFPTRRAYPIPVPSTTLSAGCLARVDWSDAYAIDLASDVPRRDPRAWAAAIFGAPPRWVRTLFAVREALVPLVGIAPGGNHAFDVISRTDDEVLVGSDHGHLDFRASVLVEPGRVVVSTVVTLHDRRGRAYSTFVRAIHPWVVRASLERAAHLANPNT
ncbi:MAG TPA: DUF2867 domain-containing protein [Nocardioides sp.]|uniref:DUF2867 domain-containing protein n=1 Tax=uncultured Nocardioides sp. TaxID=198441 RepID=UPI00263169BC|nr:DUF2867 domain-containing protein [uncultured Nocardioides sp.]HRD60318.1 DUF2867 domain-containing protein [Nocardioides sp.]HRI95571.1 DUF2867 domain-containing protein [Nocardioides sp.]